MADTRQTMDNSQRDVVLRALRRTRQIRRFIDEPVDDAIRALPEVARPGTGRRPLAELVGER